MGEGARWAHRQVEASWPSGDAGGADLGEIAETGFMPVLLAALRVMRRVEKSKTGSTSVIERLERAD